MNPLVRSAVVLVPLAFLAACAPRTEVAPGQTSASTTASGSASIPASTSASASAPTTAPTGAHSAPAKVWFEGSYADGLAQARATSKLVFIDFNTTWCGPCRKLEKETFSKPEVQAELAQMVSMSIDAESQAGLPLAQKFHISGYPEMLVLEASGKELGRISGFKSPKDFLALIAKIRARASR